jgi:hypothetical protein
MHALICIFINLALHMQGGAPVTIFKKTAWYCHGYLAAGSYAAATGCTAPL